MVECWLCELRQESAHLWASVFTLHDGHTHWLPPCGQTVVEGAGNRAATHTEKPGKTSFPAHQGTTALRGTEEP